MVVNTKKLGELEQALLDAHSKALGDPPVQGWAPSVAVRQLREQASHGQPSEVVEFSIAAAGLRVAALPGGPSACNPIALLLSSVDPWKLIGYTEWQQDTSAPAFATVLSVDAAVLPGGPTASIYVQLRHVDDPFWDAEAADTPEVLQGLRLLGRASFTLRQSLQAGAAGGLALALRRSADGTGDADVAAGSVTLQVRSSAGWPPNRFAEPHATCNFAFGLGAGGGAAAAQPARLRVCEHMLPCAYGRSVPCAVLAMLCADAELHASAEEPQARAPTDARLGQLWALQDGAGWARLAAWLGELLAGVQAGARPSGFKESARKKDRALAPVPANLQLNLLEVSQLPPAPPARALHAVFPTVSVGVPAAHCLGYAEGGAAAMAARLQAWAREAHAHAAAPGAPPAPLAELATAYAARCALLMAQAYAALAAAFALTCQTHAARRNRSFFAQLQRCGFLLQAESLLSTRGDDWGMLQDLAEAWRYLEGVHLCLMPSQASGADGVALRGGRHRPTLCFAPAELGFADAADAAALGLASDALIGVVAVVATQGINEEQTVANFLRTHTREQAELNTRALAALAEYQHRCEALANDAAAAAAAAPAAAAAAASREADDGAARRAHRQRQLLAEARRLLEAPPDAKNVRFLQAVAQLTRLLSGGRVTMCKSGKDRTSMSVTLEHGLLLRESGMPAEHARRAVQTMRRRGVRRQNVALNTKRRLYAFNWMQQQALPADYCPPEGSAAGGKA